MHKFYILMKFPFLSSAGGDRAGQHGGQGRVPREPVVGRQPDAAAGLPAAGAHPGARAPAAVGLREGAAEGGHRAGTTLHRPRHLQHRRQDAG